MYVYMYMDHTWHIYIHVHDHLSEGVWQHPGVAEFGKTMYVYSCCKSVHCAAGPDCTALAQFSAGYLKSKELHSNDDVPLKSEARSSEVGLITTCNQCLWS